MADQVTGPLTIVLFEAPEKELQREVRMLVRVSNHRDVERAIWVLEKTFTLDLAFHDGPGDDYTVVVAADGYKTTGGFVSVKGGVHKLLKLLLIPEHPQFVFPEWKSFLERFPRTASLMELDGGAEVAEKRYNALKVSQPAALASFCNLGAAMDRMVIGSGKTPLDFSKGICWDDTFAQDRFFGYVDPAIIPMIQAAAAEGDFAQEKDCAAFHAGSTCSYKQTEYDYSNVQLTFHEEDTKVIAGTKCVKIEPDMDLYKALLPHGALEVLPNLSTHGLTNPVDVLALRWVDSSEGDNESPFDPGYSFA